MADKKTFTPPPHFFTGSGPLDNDPDFHVITTDHHWMRELGLSVFTTGTLASWWDKRDERGTYVNRELIEDDGSGSFETSFGLTYFGNPVTFSAWRKGTKSGAYEEYYIDGSPPDGSKIKEWIFRQEGSRYDLDEIKLSDFTNKKVLGYKNKNEDITEDTDPSHTLGVISQVIALNDHVRHYSAFNTDSFNSWSLKEQARSEFITDIKASKEGYVSWSGEVPFNFGLADGTFQCSRQEWVTFKLFLFDETAPRSPMRTAALAKPTMVGPPKDFLGRVYKKHQDGQSDALDNADPTQQVVADLDLHYNEFTNKWEAGTTQILGKVVTDIESADKGFDISTWDTTKIEETLANPEEEGVPFKTGEVMPITMQNGNPMQWSPNYADSEDCRKDGLKKAKVVAYNFDSHASFAKNQLVMLNKIHGVWVPIEFSSGVDVVRRDSIFDGQWDFTYFATNAQFFFKDQDNNSISPIQKEKAFHATYYADDSNNLGKYGKDINTQVPFLVDYGYHQYSSFDFMDKFAGGTRGDKRSLATTQFGRGALGDTLPRNGIENKAYGSFPFFGCVFPGGYSDPKLDNFYNEGRDNNIQSYQGKTDFFNRPEFGDNKSVVHQYPFSEGNATLQDWDADACLTEASPRSAVVVGHGKLLKLGEVADDYWGEFDTWCQTAMFSAVGNDPSQPKNTSAIQLPADIGTHASPSGDEKKNGRPISDLKKLATLDATFGDDCQEACVEYFKNAYHFLYEASPSPSPNDLNNSAFNFKPTAPNIIEFRPLKWETYAAFDDADLVVPGDTQSLGGTSFDLLTEGGVHPGTYGDGTYSRRNASLYGHQHMSDGKCVASISSRDRERDGVSVTYASQGGTQLPITNLLYRTTVNGRKDLGGQGRGAPANLEQHPDYPDYEPGGLQYASDLNHGPAAGDKLNIMPMDAANFDQEIWRQYWMDDPLSVKRGGAGAVGVIGAVCTVAADLNIAFQTNNYLGMRSYKVMHAGSTGGAAYQAGVVLAGAITTDTTVISMQDTNLPSWGMPYSIGEDYKAFNTTDLSVRIYHAWPRNQTIYDPRFFAVYHFNDGIGSEQTPVETQELPIVFHDGTNHENITVDIETTAVDFRVPSVEHGPITVSTLDGSFIQGIVTVGDSANIESVYSDAANGTISTDQGAPGSTVQHLVSKDYWKVDKRRRGKLLPFNYTRTTIGIPSISEAESMNSDFVRIGYGLDGNTGESLPDPLEDVGLKPLPAEGTRAGKGFTLPDTNPDAPTSPGVKMVINNRGQGYLINETLTSNQGDAEIVIKSTGVNGSIRSFEVTHQGLDISPSQFEASGAWLRPGGAGAVVTVHGGSSPTTQGTGFEAWFVNGEIWDAPLTDEKPKIATEADHYKLSLGAHDVVAGDNVIELTQGVLQTEALLTNQSTDGRYDLFFHFHNDITHTMAGDYTNPATDRTFEQNIGLTINPR